MKAGNFDLAPVGAAIPYDAAVVIHHFDCESANGHSIVT
jgi:hypothetical protein